MATPQKVLLINFCGWIKLSAYVHATPLPAAAWLLGSALLALAGIKRKKA